MNKLINLMVKNKLVHGVRPIYLYILDKVFEIYRNIMENDPTITAHFI